MSGMHHSNRSQWKQWLAAMAATLAMVIVGTEEFWMFYTLRTMPEPEMMNDAEFVWTRLSIAATGSVIGPILGAVLADKFGRKKTLLATSIPPIIRTVCIYAIDVSSLWSCVPLFFGEIGLGMTWVVVPLYISEICDDKIRGALMMLQVPFFYVGKSITVGIELLELCLVSVVFIGIFIAAFAWLPETPCYLASKKKYDTAAKSLAFYRNIDTVAAQNDVQMIIEEIEAKTHSNGRRCCQKIHELVRGSNGKGLIIIILLIILKWSEHKLEARNYLADVIQGPLVPNVYHARLIAYIVSLVASILIVSTVDVIGRRSFLLFATFTSFVTIVVLLICENSNKPHWLYNGVCVIFHFCQLITFAIPLVYVSELFSTNVKALAITVVTIFNSLVSHVILYLEFIEGNVNSYIISVAMLISFPIVLAFIPETKRKSLADIHSEVAATTFHCSWLKNKLFHKNQPELMKK